MNNFKADFVINFVPAIELHASTPETPSMRKTLYVPVIYCMLFLSAGAQNVLTLKDALNTALSNYESIKAKDNYANAAKESLKQSRRDYLPNLVVSAQQDYGTVNGQNGPLYGYNGLGVASSGLPLSAQNWNAAFGALYLANVNWEFFTFGRIAERVKVFKRTAERDQFDLEQEKFQQQVKVAAAYLNLIAAQQLTRSQQKNLERVMVVKNNSVARARTGLIAGVDTSLANAEVSAAKITLIKTLDNEQEQANRLAVLMGVPPTQFVLDTTFTSKIPASFVSSQPLSEKDHPTLKFYQSRIDLSNEQVEMYRRFYFPSFSMFGVFQERGSGFSAAYTQNQKAYTEDYSTGVNPTRGNYLFGVGVTWNLTSIVRNSAQVSSQRFLAKGMQNEYNLVQQQLKAQSVLSDQKIQNSLAVYNEVPVQVKAASDAYAQKNALYKNGLTTIVDVTQALYALNRAETDRDIAYSNVWQSLLLKAASVGDIRLFTNEF